uniref:Uncharacterized protein n=1 Tax=Aegilops tauschii subsp. strangulata TaxID=200361 RepID=A0A453T076_AEGTS
MLVLCLLLLDDLGEQSTEKESHDMLSYSFNQVINILDTAEIAGTHSFLPS